MIMRPERTLMIVGPNLLFCHRAAVSWGLDPARLENSRNIQSCYSLRGVTPGTPYIYADRDSWRLIDGGAALDMALTALERSCRVRPLRDGEAKLYQSRVYDEAAVGSWRVRKTRRSDRAGRNDMKNRLIDLNNHLFSQLERLTEEDISLEKIEQEVKRSEAIVAVSEQIIRNSDLSLKAAKLVADHGDRFRPMLPSIFRQPETISGKVSRDGEGDNE